MWLFNLIMFVGSCPMLRDGASSTVTGAEEMITYLKEQVSLF